MAWNTIYKKLTSSKYHYFHTKNGVLLCGDCLEAMKEIPKESIDLVVTSPPYNKGYWSSNRNLNNGIRTKSRRIDYGVFKDNLEPKIYEKWQKMCISECLRILKKEGSIFYNHIDILKNHQTIYPLYVHQFPVKQIIIWNRKNTPKLEESYFFPVTEYIFWIIKTKKSKPKFKRKNAIFKSNVWSFSPDKKNKHPAPFPEMLPRNCILSTTEEKDVVLDPFIGSGTTAVVAEILNRKWIGIEINPKYCEIAKNRIKEVSGVTKLNLW